MKLLKWIGIGVLAVLVGLQFIPARSNQSTTVPPTDFVKIYNVPEDVRSILTVSCYNCHSNNTKYPWYSKVQPFGFYLENHINQGKEDLNLSEFGDYSARMQKSKLKSMISQIENGEMPLAAYTLVHREARLSEESRERFVDYLKTINE